MRRTQRLQQVWLSWRRDKLGTVQLQLRTQQWWLWILRLHRVPQVRPQLLILRLQRQVRLLQLLPPRIPQPLHQHPLHQRTRRHQRHNPQSNLRPSLLQLRLQPRQLQELRQQQLLRRQHRQDSQRMVRLMVAQPLIPLLLCSLLRRPRATYRTAVPCRRRPYLLLRPMFCFKT